MVIQPIAAEYPCVMLLSLTRLILIAIAFLIAWMSRGCAGSGNAGLETVEAAVEKTLAAATARVSWRETGSTLPIFASGVADFQHGRGEMTMYVTYAGEKAVIGELVLTEDTSRLRERSSDGKSWAPWQPTAGGAGDFLGLMGVPPGTADLALGHSDSGIDFRTALRRVVGDATRFSRDGATYINGAHVSRFVADPEDDGRALELYLDERGRIRRLVIPAYSVDSAPVGTLTVAVDLWDFGTPADIREPGR